MAGPSLYVNDLVTWVKGKHTFKWVVNIKRADTYVTSPELSLLDFESNQPAYVRLQRKPDRAFRAGQ